MSRHETFLKIILKKPRKKRYESTTVNSLTLWSREQNWNNPLEKKWEKRTKTTSLSLSIYIYIYIYILDDEIEKIIKNNVKKSVLTFKTRVRGHKTQFDHVEDKQKKNNKAKFLIKKWVKPG